MSRLQEFALTADVSSLPVQRSPVTMVSVRFLTTLLIAVLLSFGSNGPSAMAVTTTACCGANCSSSAPPAHQLSCCQGPSVPDRATMQANDAQHFTSIGSKAAAWVTIAVPHPRTIVVARDYSPPNRGASLALLCSRQI